MPVKIRFIDCIKVGAGFLLGYKLAEKGNEIAGETYKILKDRIKKGYYE